jgi:ABC-type uncharacterized transport system ATPase subunit
MKAGMIEPPVPCIEGQALVKCFGNLVACNRVHFQAFPGEVHALLGQNGAGKTTLMNLFYGLLEPDSGKILVHGEGLRIGHPARAIRHGIGMVHQNMMLIPQMSVAENVVLGQEIIHNWCFLDRTGSYREVSALSQENGLTVDPAVAVGSLPMGLRQRVEIVKVLYRDADILILDEPTALLTPQQADELFRVMRRLAAQRKSIIFITHKLREVFKVADRITVMRDGRVVATTTPDKVDEQQLADLMVGREVKLGIQPSRASRGQTLLDVQDLTVEGDTGGVQLDHVSFQLHAGEILGVAGIEGNGQTELANAIAGLGPIATGQVLVDGQSVHNLSPGAVRRLGVGFVPDDRQRLGLVLPFSVCENLVLNRYQQRPFSSRLRLHWQQIKSFASQVISSFDIRTTGVAASVGHLSGGNQQKVVLGRELATPLRLLIAAQPTRGVDIASLEFIHKKLFEAAASGTAILLIASDLDELLTCSDRIMVLRAGRNVGIVDARSATKELVGRMMLGLSQNLPDMQSAGV